MGKYDAILEEAKKDFEGNMNHIDFHNKFYGIGNSFLPQNQEERTEFLDSDVNKEIKKLKHQLEDKQPNVIEPSFSGKIALRINKSLHQELSEISKKEDISLNQILLSFLAEKVGEYKANHK